MGIKSKFKIETRHVINGCDDYIIVILVDTGHDQGFMSITNDAESVIEHLYKKGYFSIRQMGAKCKHIIYRDSDGLYDELLFTDRGTFINFKHIGASTEDEALSKLGVHVDYG